MIDQDTLSEVLALGEARRAERRRVITLAGGAVLAAGAGALLSSCGGGSTLSATPTPTPTSTSTATVSDIDILNFALNLEYLESSYYVAAAFGSTLAAGSITGTGTQGTVTGGRQVTFTDPSVAAFAREIAADENQHVVYLRAQLLSSAVAQPAINIDGGATGAFTAAARAAGVVGATETFDPYASDENFLLGGMLLSDVGVTAYRGAASMLTSKIILEAAAGILAVEAYHSGLLRTVLYAKGLTAPVLRTNADKISDARDALDGAQDDDQGITGSNGASNIVPADANGLVFGRTAAQVLNVAFLNKAAVTSGGFFPSGVNGTITTSGRQRLSAASDRSWRGPRPNGGRGLFRWYASAWPAMSASSPG